MEVHAALARQQLPLLIIVDAEFARNSMHEHRLLRLEDLRQENMISFFAQILKMYCEYLSPDFKEGAPTSVQTSVEMSGTEISAMGHLTLWKDMGWLGCWRLAVELNVVSSTFEQLHMILGDARLGSKQWKKTCGCWTKNRGTPKMDGL